MRLLRLLLSPSPREWLWRFQALCMACVTTALVVLIECGAAMIFRP